MQRFGQIIGVIESNRMKALLTMLIGRSRLSMEAIFLFHTRSFAFRNRFAED